MNTSKVVRKTALACAFAVASAVAAAESPADASVYASARRNGVWAVQTVEEDGKMFSVNLQEDKCWFPAIRDRLGSQADNAGAGYLRNHKVGEKSTAAHVCWTVADEPVSRGGSVEKIITLHFPHIPQTRKFRFRDFKDIR
jgi:hypothetical protein